MSELPGHYARVEAIDGAGKSTLMRMAWQYSQDHGIDAAFVREPGGTDLGLDLRNILLHDRRFDLDPATEFTIYTADRVYLWNNVILPALTADRPVISDRGYESAEYQIARGLISRETVLGVTSLLLPERYMKPDVLALISISKQTRLRRLAAKHGLESPDKLELRDEEYFDEIHERYKAFEELEYAQTFNNDDGRDINEVFEEMIPALFGKFAK